MRKTFSRAELLAALPEEMVAAQTQIPGNVHCNGEFYADAYSGWLICKLHVDEKRIYYVWNPDNKRWGIRK